MKTELIASTPGNDRLILIFAGWNTDPEFYSNIRISGWDTMVAFGFDGSPFPADLLRPYSTVYLFAWSLGVAAAEHFLDPSLTTLRIAVNGTPHPVSDSKGIPAAIFDATESTLNQRNLMKFRRRMAGSSRTFSEIETRLQQDPDIDKLRGELRMFRTLSETERTGFHWNRTYIASEDAIFPAENQLRAWSDGNADEVITIDAPHYVDLDKLIRSTIPDLAVVGKSFAEASATYDSNALAQQQIARRLTEMLSAGVPAGTLRILEIGPGSGVFTRLYAGKLRPASITYIDLYDIERQHLATEEEYIVGDAEQFIASTDQKWDMIISSSAIQWFVNFPAFLMNARRSLNDGGSLACSTFLPDNLSELRPVKPSTLLYQTEERLTGMIESVFGNVSHETMNISMRFASAKDALFHLRATGVGSAHNSRSRTPGLKAINILKEDPTLHYSAYLFLARKQDGHDS